MHVPSHSSSLIVREAAPLNAEPPLELLRERHLTPVELFFIRNHGAVPDVDPARYRLKVTGMVAQSLSLSLGEIRSAFPKASVTAVLQCAGNRRADLLGIAPIPGEVPWGAGAIGNARWAGVALRELLLAARPDPDAAHVAFTGFDEVERLGRRFGFGGSVPIEKATSGEVLLAYEMNGEPLAPVHGYPLRVIVPGFIGARSVKWLSEITVQARPSDNYFQAHAYKLFPPHVRAETVDWTGGLMLGEVPVNAVITRPAEGDTLRAGRALVEGYAVASGGRSVERVDLSTDDGETWTTARLLGEPNPWAWRFWEADLDLAVGPVQIIVRAWDSAAQTQPEDARKIWNFKGYMNNAWHRVNVRIEM
jgi:sulfite oxidase